MSCFNRRPGLLPIANVCRYHPLWITPLALLTLGGCVPTKPVAEFTPTGDEVDHFTSRHPAPLQPWLRTLYQEGERNAVLNYNRLGLAALQGGDLDYAHYAFDQAYRRIETIYADDEQAKKARSNWSPEEVKDFKGEPYERSMTYYYLGLTYLARGEFDNARASFLGANRQDRYAEGEEYQSDFGVMEYLAGFSSLCRGDQDDYHERLKMAADQHPQRFGEQLKETVSRTLLIFEAGEGPAKRREGAYQEKLRFVDPSSQSIERALVAGSDQPLIAAADLHYQATTRGGRAIDVINQGKAEFKSGAEGVRTGMATAAVAGLTAAQMQSSFGNNDAAAAAGMFGVMMLAGSLIADQVSKATTPQADIRSWEGLPGEIYLAHWGGERLPDGVAFSLAEESASEQESTAETAGSGEAPRQSESEAAAPAGEEAAVPPPEIVPFAWQVEHPGCSVAWARQPEIYPAEPVANLLDVDLGSERGPSNVAFRKRLVAQLQPMVRPLASGETPAEMRGDQ